MRVGGLISVVTGIVAYAVADALVTNLITGNASLLTGRISPRGRELAFQGNELPLARKARIAKGNQPPNQSIFK